MHCSGAERSLCSVLPAVACSSHGALQRPERLVRSSLHAPSMQATPAAVPVFGALGPTKFTFCQPGLASIGSPPSFVRLGTAADFSALVLKVYFGKNSRSCEEEEKNTDSLSKANGKH